VSLSECGLPHCNDEKKRHDAECFQGSSPHNIGRSAMSYATDDDAPFWSTTTLAVTTCGFDRVRF